ncbi:MAG: efflux RND transporter periplasmic adaptor subunit [Aquificaceae bacterium]
MLWIVVVFLMVASCGKKQAELPQKEALQISTYQVKKESVWILYSTKAYFEAEKDLTLKPEVSGRVVSLFVDEGYSIKTGQPLLKVDDSDYQNTVRQLSSELMQVRVNYENQRSVYERRKFLYEKELIAKEELDNARAQMEASKEQVGAIEAQLKNAKLQLRRTILYAPFSGYVAQRFVNIGDYLTPQSQTFRLVTLNPIKVVFQVPQELLSSVKKENYVDVKVDGVGNFKGRVFFLSPVADKSRMITLKAYVENPKGELRPDMYAKVDIPTSLQEGFKIPESAIILLGNRKIVWKVIRDTVEPVPVDVLKQVEGYVYVRANLKDGDTIATENASLLNQGTKVRVK